VFAECAACHSAAKGPFGRRPSLYGGIRRKAGTLDDFSLFPCDEASNIGLVARNFGVLYRRSAKAIPANRMPFGGIPDAQNRADLLDYMEQTFK